MDIQQLLEKQKELDYYIANNKKLGDPYDYRIFEKRKLALLSEVGELANATRCFKYWSSKGPEPKEIILDELADCIHFALSLIILTKSKVTMDINDSYTTAMIMKNIETKGIKELSLNFNLIFELCVREEWELVLATLINLGALMDLSLDEMVQAYLKKNQVNYNRQLEGY